ncbi:DUF6778 family protein [Paracoccus sp. IB05]|uniref:DUF6778 family protein n=1 Tax=Paracoccus sp. IB05 TaxID=2779367 RepID=UPI0018E7B3DD|nr:DUF6778 family protein [Paracoccus sp. IB05]MBJ2153802.1 hypothetical protein [Paracoccus sp. IB05]
MIGKTLLGLGLALALTACGGGGGGFETNYSQVDQSVARNWRVSKIDVVVPDTLTVSEKNSYMPNADIVWHGDPTGDRHAQVAAIFRDAIAKGTTGLRGKQPVTLRVVVTQFHALTPKARGMGGNVGVHDIRFDARIHDGRTGAPLTGSFPIKADIAALVGQDAADADARGFTQKVEITEHLEAVFRNWLGGYGEDPRNSFSRLGR